MLRRRAWRPWRSVVGTTTTGAEALASATARVWQSQKEEEVLLAKVNGEPALLRGFTMSRLGGDCWH
jgi:hypothetical protein